MSNEILDEVYAAREKLWQLGGGTMRGVCEYLRECGRRAKARGELWIESEEEREAIGAEVRARLAAEAAGETMCVGEEAGKYVAREAGREVHTDARRDGGAEGGSTKGQKGEREGSGMNKPVAYLETSFVSFLTGWVSKNKWVAVQQEATVRWWEQERQKWRCVVSDTVFIEAQGGDADAAGRRLAVLKEVESLPTTPEAVALANALVLAHALPEKARADAMHVALATVNGADVLLTWNCRHIANGVMLPRIYSTLEKAGYKCPAIVTPMQLLAAGGDEP